MSGDTWIGIVLLGAAFVVLVLATAAETGVVFVNRLRVHGFATKGVPRAEALEAYVQERQELVGTFSVARDAAVVLGIAVGTFLVLREQESTWVTLTIIMAAALGALIVLEAVPRLVVARSPERWSLRLVPAIGAFAFLFGLPIRALNTILGSVLRLFGRERAGEAGEGDEELLRLVQLREENGGIENGELEMIRRIAGMVDRAVREIMVPRIDMVAAEDTSSVDDVLRLVMERGFSRIPLYEESIDNIVGIVHAKDLLQFLADGQRPGSLREIARPPYFVPEGKHVDELLTELREHRVHLAIVVDEYGGTAGLVTIEDVIEEIVGEIQDEYDREEATVQPISESEAIMDARVSLDELNELFDLEIESEDYDTVGGFVYHQLGRMPAPGDEVQANGLDLRVLSVLGRRIKKIRVVKEPASVGSGDQEKETA